MTSDLRTKALQLFDEYVDMPHHRQSRALALLREEDPPLHDLLVQLLVADASDYALDSPPAALLSKHRTAGSPADAVEADPRLGTRLGPWRIERVLGIGGMGTVYQAQRDDGHYRQCVALKCMRSELSSPRLIEAFLNERNNLARLEHPGIATLFDGGVEPNGQPWFAMRYVQGEPIDQWCDERQLSVRRRIELLVQACEALAYAHSERVLHQDIKPSNLLVTAQGQVQLLDFGLSSTLAADGPRSAPIAFSNGYAAPELLVGGRPSVTADIYALGVVAYRLLCGDWPSSLELIRARMPIDLPHKPRPMHTLVDLAPTTVARLRSRPTVRALARELEGDLEAIALKCVATDPDQRFGSVAELKEELQRWLEHRPVQARQGGMGYRLGRFLRRNRVTVGLGVGVALAMISGSALIAWHSRHAAQEARATLAVSQLFEQTLGTATLSGLGETNVSSQALLQRTERQLRAQKLHSQPVVMARALSILARNYAAIGQYEHATQLAFEADTLGQGDLLQNADTRATLASLLNLQAQHAQARDMAVSGLELLERAKNSDAPAVGIRLSTELARALWGLAEYDKAFAMLESALALAQKEPTAELLTLRGHWRTRLYQVSEAERDLNQAIEMTQASDPLIADMAREALVHLLMIGGREESAMQLGRTLLQSRQNILGANHPDTARAWVELAEVQFRQGDHLAAAESLRQGQNTLRTTYGPQHPEYAESLRIQALLDDSADDSPAAENKAREAVAILERTIGPLHEKTLRAKYTLADILSRSALSLDSPTRARHLNEAIALLEEIFHTDRRRRVPVPQTALRYAQALMARAGATGLPDLAVAEATLKEQLTQAGRLYPTPSKDKLAVHQTLARLYMQLARTADAEAELAVLTSEARTLLPDDRAKASLCDALLIAATLAARQGKSERAIALFEEAQAQADEFFGYEDVVSRRIRDAKAEYAEHGRVVDPLLSDP